MAGITMIVGFLFLGRFFVPQAFGGMLNLDPSLTFLFLYVSFVTSMMFLCLGVLGEYISVLILEIKQRPTAIVRHAVGEVLLLPSASYVQRHDVTQPAPGRTP